MTKDLQMKNMKNQTSTEKAKKDLTEEERQLLEEARKKKIVEIKLFRY